MEAVLKCYRIWYQLSHDDTDYACLRDAESADDAKAMFIQECDEWRENARVTKVECLDS